MAIETLRPSAAGDLTNFSIMFPNSGEEHWQDVDEAVADDDTTYVQRGGVMAQNYFRIAIKENAVKTNSGQITISDSYALYSNAWTVRPSDGQPFNWTDIGNLQIGVDSDNADATSDIYNISAPAGSGTINSVTVYARAKYISGKFSNDVRVTQVYVEIDYTLASGGNFFLMF